MKQFKVDLRTRGGNCSYYVPAKDRESAIKIANQKWPGMVLKVQEK